MITLEKETKISLVKECPHAKPAKGVLRMPAEMISMLAAAVQDKDEWAIILKGTRSDDGFEASVTSFWMPQQDRSGGHVSIKEYTGLQLENGEFKQNDDIAVIHSHNSMNANFSSLDKNELNPRFPISIVIAQTRKNSPTYLGFSYEGVGKVKLPCGATAEIPFFIQPLTGPTVAEVVRFTPETNEVNDLHDCVHYEDLSADEFHVHFKAKCGLQEPQQLRADAFGKADKTLLKLVEALPRALPIKNQFGGQFGGLYNGNQRDDWMRSDPDSKWCNTHQRFDFCEYQKKNGLLKRMWCPTHQEVDDCRALIDHRSKQNDNKQNGKGKKGDKRDRGWLGKYEDHYRSSSEILCLAPGCFKVMRKGMFCSQACMNRYDKGANDRTVRWCTVCAKKQADDADGFCSQKCFAVAQKQGKVKWCLRCIDWTKFSDHTFLVNGKEDTIKSCDNCGILYCKTCDYGHGKDVECTQSRGKKQPDGCIIIH